MKILIEPEFLEFAGEFLVECTREISKMKDFLKEGKFQDIAFLAHKIKGSGGSYGFTDLSQMAESLQHAAKASKQVDCQSLLEKLENHCKEATLVAK